MEKTDTHTHPSIKAAASHIAQDTDTSTRGGGGSTPVQDEGGFMFQQFQLFPNVFVLRIQHCVLIVMGVGCRGESRGQGESSKITNTRIWVSNCYHYCYRYPLLSNSRQFNIKV